MLNPLKEIYRVREPRISFSFSNESTKTELSAVILNARLIGSSNREYSSLEYTSIKEQEAAGIIKSMEEEMMIRFFITAP